LYLVGILFPHINDDARSKPHQVFEHVVENYEFLVIIAC